MPTTLHIRARELRPGDVIVEPWGDRIAVVDTLVPADGSMMTAYTDWPNSAQKVLPYRMAASSRITIERGR